MHTYLISPCSPVSSIVTVDTSPPGITTLLNGSSVELVCTVMLNAVDTQINNMFMWSGLTNLTQGTDYVITNFSKTSTLNISTLLSERNNNTVITCTVTTSSRGQFILPNIASRNFTLRVIGKINTIHMIF